MDPSNTATPQAEAAATPTVVDPAPAAVSQDPVAASQALTDAVISGASPAEIQTLRTALDQARQQPAAPAEPVVVAAPEPAVDPAPVAEPAAEAPAEPVVALEAGDDLTEPAIPGLAGEEPQEEGAPRVSDRQRIAHLSEEDKLASAAINLLTRKGLSLAEATQRVLGDINPPAAPAAQPAAPAPAPGEDLPALLARQTELETVLENAAKGENLFDADINAASNELRKITARIVKAEMAKEMAELRESVKAQKQTETDARQTVFEAARDKAWQETRNQYTELSDSESPLYLMTKAIADMARTDPEHPLHVHARTAGFVKHCAAKAAARLGVTPASKAAPASNGKTAPPAAPAAAPRPGPASGSRASAPPAPAPSKEARVAESAVNLQAVLEGNIGAYKVQRPGGFVR